jgi:hypothetical protein
MGWKCHWKKNSIAILKYLLKSFVFILIATRTWNPTNIYWVYDQFLFVYKRQIEKVRTQRNMKYFLVLINYFVVLFIYILLDT